MIYYLKCLHNIYLMLIRKVQVDQFMFLRRPFDDEWSHVRRPPNSWKKTAAVDSRRTTSWSAERRDLPKQVTSPPLPFIEGLCETHRTSFVQVAVTRDTTAAVRGQATLRVGLPYETCIGHWSVARMMHLWNGHSIESAMGSSFLPVNIFVQFLNWDDVSSPFFYCIHLFAE